MLTKAELIAFEEDIKRRFLNREIRAPVHLSKGNEDQLIEIFKEIKPEDWCFSTHRSHLHALLKGIPPDWLRNEILQGRSMHIMSAEHRFLSSSIVGGICPIALGLAMAIKWASEKSHVWCFVGDMASCSGIFSECARYAAGHALPITFVVEDNFYSTNTPTRQVWGEHRRKAQVLKYEYIRGFPHTGVGQFVQF